MMSSFVPQDSCFSTNTLPLKMTMSTPTHSSNDPPSPSSATCSTSDPQSVKVQMSPSVLTKEIELGEKRQSLMEKYMEKMKEKDKFEVEYKKRKERRERLKIRALKRIGQELHNIAVTQCEILKRQDQILTVLQS